MNGERSEQSARRKSLYEAKHPQTKHGGLPGKAGGGKGTKDAESASFVQDTATKTGQSKRTVAVDVQIAKNIPKSIRDAIRDTPVANRKEDLLALARLPKATQSKVAKKITDNSAKTVKEALRQVTKEQRIKDLDGGGETCILADLTTLIKRGHKFRTIYADPPWQYGNQATRSSTDNHYETMLVEEIAALPIAELADEDAHLHLWTTNAFLFDCKRIMEAWGFEYKSVFVWCKPQMGIGNYWRVSHEFLLLGTRGSAPFMDRGQMSWAEIDRTQHSAKPEAVRKMVEKVSPGPRLELFGRGVADGWTVWGNEIKRTTFDASVLSLTREVAHESRQVPSLLG